MFRAVSVINCHISNGFTVYYQICMFCDIIPLFFPETFSELASNTVILRKFVESDSSIERSL